MHLWRNALLLCFIFI